MCYSCFAFSHKVYIAQLSYRNNRDAHTKYHQRWLWEISKVNENLTNADQVHLNPCRWRPLQMPVTSGDFPHVLLRFAFSSAIWFVCSPDFFGTSFLQFLSSSYSVLCNVSAVKTYTEHIFRHLPRESGDGKSTESHVLPTWIRKKFYATVISCFPKL